MTKRKKNGDERKKRREEIKKNWHMTKITMKMKEKRGETKEELERNERKKQ